MQLQGAEHDQHHEPVVVRQCLGNAGLLPDHRVAAVTAHDVIGAQRAFVTGAIGDVDKSGVVILADIFTGPAIHRRDRWNLRRPLPQYRFGSVLRQSLVAGEIIGAHQFTLQPVVVVAAEKRAMAGHAAHAVVRRNGAALRAIPSQHPRSGSAPWSAGSGSALWGSAADSRDARPGSNECRAGRDRSQDRHRPARLRRSPPAHRFAADYSSERTPRGCCVRIFMSPRRMSAGFVARGTPQAQAGHLHSRPGR